MLVESLALRVASETCYKSIASRQLMLKTIVCDKRANRLNKINIYLKVFYLSLAIEYKLISKYCARHLHS